jgi:Arc/MetJ-type ribon-helix-helix transcriptional regulator
VVSIQQTLTPEQERLIRAVLSRGAYQSVEELVEAALTAVEQRTVRAFTGTPEELDTLLSEGLAPKQLAEDESWSSVTKQTDAGQTHRVGFFRSSWSVWNVAPPNSLCRRLNCALHPFVCLVVVSK